MATSHKKSGGGSLIAIRKGIANRRLPMNFDIECIFVLVTMGLSLGLLIACVYIPPSSPLCVYRDFCDAVNEVVGLANQPKKILIFGDFNLPHFDLNMAKTGPLQQANEFLCDMSSFHSLHQINHVRNHRGVSLDLVFSSDPEIQVIASSDWLVSPDIHHPPLSLALVEKTQTLYTDCYMGHNLRQCDLPSTLEALQRTDLSFVYDLLPIDDKFNRLMGILENVSLNASPMKRFGVSRFPRWFSSDLKKLIIQKKIAHKRYKNSLNLAHYYEFSHIRNTCKSMSRECYIRFLSHVETNISNSPRAFWGLVKAQRRSPDMPCGLYLDGDEANDSQNKCRLFSTFFSSVYSPPSGSSLVYNEYPVYDCLSNIRVTKEEVLLKLEHLDTKKGAGLDNIPPSVVHYCRYLLAEPLKCLFNESLEKGVFPGALKNGYIIPLHKSNDPCNVRNYRPITILPVVGKLFEGFIVDKLNPFMSKIIHPSQHGFIRGKSTVSNLLIFQEFVLAAFRKNQQVDAIYIDMAKAFDKVDHSILLAKLKGYGMADPLLSWISSYLLDRSLFVKIDSSISNKFSPSSGVPQGSLLGPYLFNIFINDLLEIVNVNALQFADDLKVFTVVTSPEDSQKLQESLIAIEAWCKKNNMSVNPSKCSSITFHRIRSPTLLSYFISNSQIPRLQSIKDLGVRFSSDMGFSEHIEDICRQANKMLGFIMRFSRGINNPTALRALYCPLVRQVMEYASPVWSPYEIGAKSRLEALQRRFIRLVGIRLGYRFMNVPVETFAEDLNLPPLALRRDVADVLLLWKIMNGRMQCSDLLAQLDFKVPTHTRSRDLLSRRQHSTNFDLNSPLARLVRLGNQLAPECDFFCDSLHRIRRQALEVFSD